MKVVNQDRLPVSGVEAQIAHGGNYYIGSNAGQGKYVSDSDGILSIEFDDRQVSLNKIAKPGYRFNWRKTHFAFKEGRAYKVPAHGDFWPIDMKRFDKKHPFIINAWRVDPVEQAADCINGRVFNRMHADGRAYGLNFLNVTKSGLSDKIADPHILISFSREHVDELPQQDYLRNEIILQTDWRYTIEALNGGIQEIKPGTLYMKKPPQTGYVSHWVLDRHIFTPRKSEYGSAIHEDDRHFYLRLGEDVYARISVRFKPMGSAKLDYDNGEITIDYSINTDGSGYVLDADGRNLQRNTTKYRNDICTDPVKY